MGLFFRSIGPWDYPFERVAAWDYPFGAVVVVPHLFRRKGKEKLGGTACRRGYMDWSASYLDPSDFRFITIGFSFAFCSKQFKIEKKEKTIDKC